MAKGAIKKMRQPPQRTDVDKWVAKGKVEAPQAVGEASASGLQVASDLEHQQPEALATRSAGETSTPTGPGIVERADGRVLRRLVVYLEPDCAKQLKVQSVLSGRDMSAIVNELVERWVDGVE